MNSDANTRDHQSGRHSYHSSQSFLSLILAQDQLNAGRISSAKLLPLLTHSLAFHDDEVIYDLSRIRDNLRPYKHNSRKHVSASSVCFPIPVTTRRCRQHEERMAHETVDQFNESHAHASSEKRGDDRVSKILPPDSWSEGPPAVTLRHLRRRTRT